jgi:hypothetical protein
VPKAGMFLQVIYYQWNLQLKVAIKRTESRKTIAPCSQEFSENFAFCEITLCVAKSD